MDEGRAERDHGRRPLSHNIAPVALPPSNSKQVASSHGIIFVGSKVVAFVGMPSKNWANDGIYPFTGQCNVVHYRMGQAKPWTYMRIEPLSGEPWSILHCKHRTRNQPTITRSWILMGVYNLQSFAYPFPQKQSGYSGSGRAQKAVHSNVCNKFPLIWETMLGGRTTERNRERRRRWKKWIWALLDSRD